jgi:Domain of unknown function (DUF397)
MSPVRERDTVALALFADEMKAARVPTRDLAVNLDKAFGTPGTFTRLEGRLRDLPFPASFRPFAAYETEATALYVFEHSLIAVRDSKDPDGTRLAFEREAWEAFAARVKADIN